VTKWFNDAVSAKSPDMKADGQMRRIVCLLKAVSKTRSSYNWPSGLLISVLAHDRYVSDARDDVSFIKTVRQVVSRLNASQSVRHPIVNENIADESDTQVCWMRDKLSEFVEKFKTLEDDCASGVAMRIWDQVFGTTFFSARLAEKAYSVGFAAVPAVASSFTRPPDADRWG
jgi:hypothetical protein